MRSRQPFPDHLRQLAERQEWVLARRQLLAADLVDSQIARLTDQGVLRRLDVGLVQLGPSTPSWRQWAWGGVLLGGRGARLMRRSAGALVEIVPERLPIEVAVSSKLTDRAWVTFLRAAPGVRSTASTGQPPRTLTPDTVLDLCAVATSEEEIVGLLATACQRQTTPAQLRRALAHRKRMPHRSLVTAVLAEVTIGVRSPLESRWLRDVERPHGLPTPTGRNARLGRDGVPDVRYDAYRVLIELDGQAYHRDAFRDWRRDNGRSEEGWLTLRYGWRDVIGDRCRVAGNVVRVLQNRGWAGELVPCSPQCGRSLR